MRLGVYTDYAYVRERDGVYAERAFSLFLARLAAHVDSLVLIGRLKPGRGLPRYRLPAGSRFVPLPYYESLARPLPVARALLGSARRFWRALGDVDAVLLLGPHPLAVAFAAMARLRRRRVILGVRQDTPAYVRHRHPRNRLFNHLAGALDATYRAMALRLPTVVVGPALGDRYRGAGRLLELIVSLIEEDDVVESAAALGRSYDETLTVMSVGRLEEEKNPLLLADVLAKLVTEDGRRWRLVVCGEGALERALAARLVELGVAERADLLGYVQAGEPMNALYRESHFLLHTSWTEGFPQILIEAFAAGLPVVAADVGGIRAAVGDAAVLVPPGEPGAAADALRRLAADARERGALIEAGLAYARQHTIDREIARLAAFLAERGGGGGSTGAGTRRGLRVALLGPDGAGKSSAVAAIGESLPIPVRSIYMGVDKRGERPRSSWRPPGIGLLVSVGRQWQRWSRGAYHATRGRLVLFDRYTYDVLLPVDRPLRPRDRVRRAIIAHCCPPPDLVVILDAPAAVLHRRKPEHDAAFQERQRARYLDLARRLPRAVVVDAGRDPDSTRRDVIAAIRAACAQDRGSPGFRRP